MSNEGKEQEMGCFWPQHLHEETHYSLGAFAAKANSCVHAYMNVRRAALASACASCSCKALISRCASLRAAVCCFACCAAFAARSAADAFASLCCA